MATGSLMPQPKQQFLSPLGVPLVGGKLFTYATGTTNPLATYTDPACTTPQPNPITLNARGEPTNTIYWSGSYRVVLQDALGNTVYTVDNFTDNLSYVTSALAALQLADYTALRAYAGGQQRVSVTGYLVTASPSGIAGDFVRDDSDTTSADNGGLVIVDALARRWKRIFNGSVSTLWFGADPTFTNDSTAAIQAAVNACGLGRKLRHPFGTYKINGTIVKPAGQIWEGDGWSTVTGSYALAGGSVLKQTNTTDIPMVQISGADDAHQVERGGFRDIAFIHSVTNSPYGTGVQALNSRQEQFDNVYIASFNIGVEQGTNCWQWAMRNVRIMDAIKCLYAHDEGEDSSYVACTFRPYRGGGIAVHLKNMSQTNLFLGCDMSNGTTGLLLEQGDNAGNGTGTPYPMHATVLNCQFEELTSEAVKLISSNGNASVMKNHPQLIAIGCRAYISSNPNVGQVFLRANQASYVEVRGLQSQGYSNGITIGATVGQVIWRPGPGAQFSSPDATGQLDRIFEVPTCRLQATALAFGAGSFNTIPYATVVSDVAGWASGNGIKPLRPGTYRARASIYIDAAAIGRYSLILKKNGGSDLTIADFYMSTAGQPLMLSGEGPAVAGGDDTFNVVLYSTVDGSIDTAFTTFSLDVAGG